MAATHPAVRLPGGAAGQLVLAGGGLMPARLLLAPVGASLPSGVLPVVAVPATAVVATTGGSGNRAIRLLRRAAVPAPVGARLPSGVHPMAAVPATGGFVAPSGSAIHLLPPLAAVAAPGPGELAADDWEYEWEGAYAFYEFIDTQALDAKRVLCETLLPAVKADAELYTKFEAVLIALHRGLGVTPQSHPDKMNLALWVIRGSYGMVKLAHDVYPSDGLLPLPGEQAFISMCLGLGLADEEQSPPPMILGQAVAPLLSPLLGSNLLGPEVPDADHDLIRSVFLAVAVSQAAARTAHDRYISDI